MKSTFNLRKPKSEKETLILFSAYFKNENKKFVYSTGETIIPKEWDFKNKQPNNLSGRTKIADTHRSIKRQLDRYSNFFIEITNQYKNTNQEITIEAIRNEFDANFKKVSSRKNKFYDTYDEFMSYKMKNKEWSNSTVKRYNNIKNLLKDFEEKRSYKLGYNSINQKFYTEFTDFCMSEKNI